MKRDGQVNDQTNEQTECNDMSPNYRMQGIQNSHNFLFNIFAYKIRALSFKKIILYNTNLTINTVFI